jgi:hypothetical protein
MLPALLTKYSNINMINKIDNVIKMFTYHKKKGIFYNSKKSMCSIYESGLMIYNCLNKSVIYDLEYTEDTTFLYNYDFCIVNEHFTVNNWITKQMITCFNKPSFCIVTEVSFSKNCIARSPNFYTAYIVLDSSIDEQSNIYGFPRPLEDSYNINSNHDNVIPIIGSFGFATHGKSWHKIVEETQKEFEEAIVRFNIPFATHVPDNEHRINEVISSCKSILKNSKIKLEITHFNFSKEELIKWCSENTINCFIYEREHLYDAGLCATTDQAIVSERPLLVSKDIAFRHIHKYIDYYPNISIKQAIKNTIDGVKKIKVDWSSKKFLQKFEKILILYKTESLINYTIFDYQVSAYYHIQNYTENANITAKIVQLFDDYKNNNIDTFIVSNDIFSDTCFGHIKCLFINININNKIYELKFEEHQEVSWNDIFNTINAYLIDNNTQYLIQVSMGEIIDKYSILEIKCKYISDKLKLQDINKEMDILEKHVTDIKTSHFYKMLRHINEQIWLDTDIIKGLNIDNKDQQSIYNFAITSKQIFDNNQRRFRLKNYFNILKKSNIKEHKSYITDSCFIAITEENDIYHKIPEINYLCISYDAIYFNNSYKNTICKLFKNPNIYFVEDDIIEQAFVNKYTLQTYSIDAELRPKFDFTPIKYKSGGKFGDFLNQLSVICEKFYETGQKGELYIYNLKYECEQFAFGLDNTYNDTYDIISSQNYIKTYKIYNNESIDINLSSWREKLVLSHWGDIYKLSYDVSWGSHKWLNINFIDDRWSNKILINITPFRFLSKNAFLKMQNHIALQLSDCIFISNEIDYYDFFCNNTGLKIDYYQPKNFVETVAIINSCKLGYFGFSSMAVIANSLHKPHYLIGIANNDFILNNMKIYMPHVIDILV